jgi:hypothetical protein
MHYIHSSQPCECCIEEPCAGKSQARLCVQLRLACSAGDKPARVKSRSPVAWVATWRETKMLKPTDDLIYRVSARY